jgi:hypothetical protein
MSGPLKANCRLVYCPSAGPTPFLSFMATTYQVTVQLSEATLDQLSASGNVLYGLLATQTSDTAALPLVWLSQPKYSMATLVEWSDAYQVYTSSSPLSTTAGPVFVGASAALQLGQLLRVTANGNVGQPLTGFPGKLTVYNTTDTAYVAGVMQAAGGAPATPTCGLPLNGHEGLMLVPQAKLVLLFSSAQVATGQAITQWLHTAYDAVLIDLTTATQRSLAFDINAGWSWGQGVWATVEPFGTDLSQVLIIPTLQEPTASQWAMLQL